MSSTSGSPTKTGWKRRSSAASFSTCLRYSSRVVAPMQRSSPRASAGFSMLAASIAPSAAPAPTIVCSSSMNRMTIAVRLGDLASTAFSRSSNSPRYFEPRQRAEVERHDALVLQALGHVARTMRWASPSAIAVLPTPGSPISTGLFFVRRESTWITRRISSSRPITGSTLPWRATSVRSRPNFSSAWYLLSGSGSVTRAPAAHGVERLQPGSSRSAPTSRSTRPAASSRVARDREQQMLGRDVLVLAVLGLLEGRVERPLQCGRDRRRGCAPPDLGQRAEQLALDRIDHAIERDADLLQHRDRAALRSARRSARNRCAGVIWEWPRVVARLWASLTASWLLIVSLSNRMGGICARGPRQPQIAALPVGGTRTASDPATTRSGRRSDRCAPVRARRSPAPTRPRRAAGTNVTAPLRWRISSSTLFSGSACRRRRVRSRRHPRSRPCAMTSRITSPRRRPASPAGLSRTRPDEITTPVGVVELELARELGRHVLDRAGRSRSRAPFGDCREATTRAARRARRA